MIVHIPCHETHSVVRKFKNITILKSIRNKPLTIANGKSTVNPKAYISRVEHGFNDEYEDCVKKCLDESKNISPQNRFKNGPYRIYVSLRLKLMYGGYYIVWG